jgi:DNA-binding NarL/FixJ family response regulator
LSAPLSSLHILIADSAQLRLQLIAGALGRRPDFRVSRCALDAEMMTAFLHSQGADVLLVNLEQNGAVSKDMDCVRRVHLAFPPLPIVLLVSAYDHELVANGFRSGARGIFCFASADFRLLCKCLHCVQKGQVWANAEQLRMLLESVGHSPSLHVPNLAGKVLLSTREQQVVALIAEGFSNRQIANDLHLSENTIKKYLFRIFEKVGVSSRVELALYVVNSGAGPGGNPAATN